MGNPRLPDIQTLVSMGFNPAQVDKLAKYMGNTSTNYIDRVDAYKKLFRAIDREQFVNRFQWHNLPNDLNAELIERILYYKYSGIFFYLPELNSFKFLPYVGIGLDEYGRYTSCQPLPFNGKSEKNTDTKEPQVYIPGLVRKPVYDITKTVPRQEILYTGESININPILDGCVILNSRCKGLAQKEIPDQQMMDVVLQDMAEVMPLSRTNMFANAGTKGMRVNNPDEYSNVLAANASLERAALNGERFVPVTGQQDFQEFGDKGNADGEDFAMRLQFLDNLRLQYYGLKNNGIFEKNQYINNQMAGNIQANVGQIYNDALKARQDFCDMVNAIWGLGIWCSASETVTNSDTNMDGETVDENQTVAPDEAQGVESNE